MGNIPLFKVFMSNAAAEAACATLKSGWVGQGPKVEQFEEELRGVLGTDDVVTTNSATSALQLALRMARVGVGDEVISTPLTFFATNATILAANAKIKWADVDPDTCNIDIDDVINKVSFDTRAIVVVHWGGTPVNIARLKEGVFDRYGFCPPIIEDCAHAIGATYPDGRTVGNSGNYCAFSFQAIKHLTTVDGGALTLPSPLAAHYAKLLRWYGMDREAKDENGFRIESDIEHWGYKFHMNDLSASIGLENIKHLSDIISMHQENASYYNFHLGGMPHVDVCSVPEGATSTHWLYTIKVFRRPDFIRHMKGMGITASVLHNRNDLHPCMSQFRTKLPRLDSLDKEYVCIPVGWWVTPLDRARIVDAIGQGW